MRKKKGKPSGLELLMSFVSTLICTIVVFFLSAGGIWYYTSSIKYALLVVTVGLIVASGIASFRFFWRAYQW